MDRASDRDPEVVRLRALWLATIRGPLRGKARQEEADRVSQLMQERCRVVEDAERERKEAERIAERKAHNAARMRVYRATHPDYKS